MSQLLQQILGQRTVTVIAEDDVPPVMAGRTRPATITRRDKPQDDEEKKLRNRARKASVVASIIGMGESDEESIIPDSAKRIDPFSSHNIPGMTETPGLDGESPAEPALTNIHGEELIQPNAALVAPDVTPKLFQQIDPSQVPAPPKPAGPPPGTPVATAAPGGESGALDTILGRQNPARSPAPAPPPVAVESFIAALNPYETQAKAAEALVPASAGGAAMPEHKEGDGRTIYSAFRSLVG